MKIEDPHNTEELHFFKELVPGDVFRFQKKYYYIRAGSSINIGDGILVNAISLDHGFAATFYADDVVEPLPNAVLIPNG